MGVVDFLVAMRYTYLIQTDLTKNIIGLPDTYVALVKRDYIIHIFANSILIGEFRKGFYGCKKLRIHSPFSNW